MTPILVQQIALDHFDRLRFQARFLRHWHRLRCRPQNLLPLAPIRDRLLHSRAFPQGTQMVPVRQIVGSLQRTLDYDRQFRPLNDGLRSRWVGVRVLNETVGWKPVDLVRVGNLYFVVDGHHRVSVARHSGQARVEATVNSYPLPVEFNVDDSLADVFNRLHMYYRANDEESTAMANYADIAATV
ncbi:MAG: hypothetical protein R3293_14435 [Candidatus Promineifilaceae bacterium]|nr:hypothetical protein [Candidatus Promineifilaceae bacterium]